MSRHSREATAESRKNIVLAAAELFRAKGYEAASLDDIMRAAGMTVGTFYVHFPSKAALFVEALAQSTAHAHQSLMGERAARELRGERWIERFIETYISEAHRNNVATGCPMPALISDVPRFDAETREVIEQFLVRFIERHTGSSKRIDKDLEARLLSMLCLCVGAIAVSRAVNSKTLSKKILKAAKQWALSHCAR